MGFKNSNKGLKTNIIPMCNLENIICKISPLSWFSIRSVFRGLFVKLESVMGEFINFCFNDGDKEFIGITRYGAIWTNSPEKYRLSFNKTSLKLTINYVLDNCYLTLGSMRFRQLIEIPMGSDPALIWQRSGFFRRKN